MRAIWIGCYSLPASSWSWPARGRPRLTVSGGSGEKRVKDEAHSLSWKRADQVIRGACVSLKHDDRKDAVKTLAKFNASQSVVGPAGQYSMCNGGGGIINR